MTAHAQEFTRGVGVYPGNPRESFAPTLQVDPTYRNVALRRPAYASSSYDYNLTPQLVTDGIVDTRVPRTIATTTSAHGTLERHAREWLVDDNPVTAVELPGPSAWVQLALNGGETPLEIDRIAVVGNVQPSGAQSVDWKMTVLGSDDGEGWVALGSATGTARPPELSPLGVPVSSGPPSAEPMATLSFSSVSRSHYYRVVLDSSPASTWRVGELRAYLGAQSVPLGGPYDFTSAWMSGGRDEEWIAIDLGTGCTIDKLVLHWVNRPAEGTIEISDTGTTWQQVQTLARTPDTDETVLLTRAVRARHVRLRLAGPASAGNYVLSELEVFGRGGLVARPAAAPVARPDGRLDLAGGRWRLERASQVSADGAALSRTGFDDRTWLVATVPGTILSSYYNAGALPDPNFGDNQLMISDAFFHSDFWYRTEFAAPALAAGRHAWLNFDGINWKADVYLNGEQLGRIGGGFTRARFDVTERLRTGGRNALAVRIRKVAHPGSVKEKTYQNPDKNGGALGADNPTYHASIGWDWIPTIRGRNAGIWNDVFLTTSGPVTIEDPLVTSVLPLPDTSRAEVTLRMVLRNDTAEAVSGTLRVRFGEITLEAPATVPANAETAITLDPTTHPALAIVSPRLWWPNGYGDPALHDVRLRFETGSVSHPIVSSEVTFKAGIRQFTYSEEGGALRLWINGRRFIPRGGNWGFPESMLRYRAREYDIAMRYHRDMNFNMVRNWVGQNGDDELYEAADKYGIVIWQDFWLANPWDGPDPDDEAMFMRTVTDTILRIRRHASVGLYCGRNEGYPPKTIDIAIRQALAAEHPGMHYISSSADDVVSGHGPYQAMPLSYYFDERATELLHSEMGMPNIVTMDSLKQMMPPADLWPQGRMWGLHDFSLEGAQGGRSYLERIENDYGPAANAEEWVALAQFVNYDGYRAMYEAQSRRRMGLLIWMSHPAWPSFVWQTYDYFFDTSAGFYGAKKASEPLHVQMNPMRRPPGPFGGPSTAVEVVNYSAGDRTGLTVTAQVLNLDGTTAWEKSAVIDIKEDSTVSPFPLEFPPALTPVHVVRLRLAQGETVLSQNDYVRGTREGDLRGIRKLPAATVAAETTLGRAGEEWTLTTRIRNLSLEPALMVRVKVAGERSGDRILPAFSSDNYVVLMPGDARTITTQVLHADTRGEQPIVIVEGFNVNAVRAAMR
ncbi:MAG: glycosyl hydrolase 2 galactose-binding domain-containing protein [Acidobacteriota bacterium]